MVSLLESFRSGDALAKLSQKEIRRSGRRQLSDVLELSEDSDLSISSDDSDDDIMPDRQSRQPRETDEELLDRTLKEYVDPLHPPQDTASPRSSVFGTRDAVRKGESSTPTRRTAALSTSGREQPSVEEDHDDVDSGLKD